MRRDLGLTQTDVAAALNSGLDTISQLERGQVRGSDIPHRYRAWLTIRNETTPTKIAT